MSDCECISWDLPQFCVSLLGGIGEEALYRSKVTPLSLRGGFRFPYQDSVHSTETWNGPQVSAVLRSESQTCSNL